MCYIAVPVFSLLKPHEDSWIVGSTQKKLSQLKSFIL